MAASDRNAGPHVIEPARVPLLYDPKIRAIASQLVLVLVVAWLGWEMITNAARNLEQQNIASGFGFLKNTAGFGIVPTLGTYLVDYAEQSSYGSTFFVGLYNTLVVAVIGITVSTVLGFILGIARLSPNWVIAKLAAGYVEIVRNIPLLLQLFFWYFAVLRNLPTPRQSYELGAGVFLNARGLFLPRPHFLEGAGVTLYTLIFAVAAAVIVRRWARKRQEATGQLFPVFWSTVGLVIGLPLLVFLASGSPISFEMPELRGFNYRGGMVVIPEFASLVLALSIYTAAFIGEVVRAGILAVSHGQTEAARALGLRNGPTLRLVVIPQAMRVIIPPLTNQYLNLTKNSSLAVAIAYPDLVSVFAGTVLNQTGQAVEILLITMTVYLTISVVTAFFMNWFNARMALVER